MNKYFRKSVVVIIAIFLVGVAFLTLNFIVRKEPSNIASCQNTVNAFSALVHGQGAVPEHLLKQDAVKNGTEFDVNEYFSVLTHLSMENGYVLDYVYFFEAAGGEPILYARKSDQAPYKTYSEYLESLNSSVHLTPWDVEYYYLDHIQVDDSPEGYFELILLRRMARQFYQHWHAFYNDATVLCDNSLISAFTAPNAGKIPFTQKILLPFRRVEPSVALEGNNVVVDVTLFSAGGAQFTRMSYTISKSFPHALQKENVSWRIIYGDPILY